jgi:hypothetical protein
MTSKHLIVATACLLAGWLTFTRCSTGNEPNNVPPVDSLPSTDGIGIDTTLAQGYSRTHFGISSDIIRNPERGFFNHLEWANAGGTPTSSATFASLKNQNLSLVANIYYMSSYTSQPLDAAMLTLIENNLKAARDNGFKVVLRFAYTSNQNATVKDALPEVTTGHIGQLQPILQAYADVIAVVEAGFVGVWGEWYYTDNYGTGIYLNVEKRNQVVDALLAALPQERMVCLRTPNYKYKLLNLPATDTLTRSIAYNGSKQARLAFHNDCFLASSNDMGTFFSDADRIYSAADSRYVAMGGETCAPSEYSECLNALTQMHDYHWSYLNKDYHSTVLGSWSNGGCMDEVKKRLGYRFELLYADIPSAVKKGADLTVKCLLRNSGFAAPYNPRDVYLLLLDNAGNELHRAKQSADPRFWMSDEHQLVSMSLPIPATISAGTYTLALFLPDPQPNLAANPDYAIRLANIGLWNEAKGYNTLLQLTINN